jgi:2,4-dienoyl-CoA reductase-like NADH-dependent reductase (Old Yellow Enzyme family)/thioredoxin reductase
MNPYPRLFSPLRVGSLTLPNRIVMPPMGTRLATSSGGVTREQREYYRVRAAGGAGLIITESCYISPERPTGHLAIHSNDFLPGLNLLAETIQEENCLAFVQLNHRGILHGKNVNDLTQEEIGKFFQDFGTGAARAKAAGFNGIEIHGGNVYLIHQFLSPRVNKRRDEYGGDLQGRLRFPLRVLEECRNKVGDAYPIFFRLNGNEFIDGGWDLEQAKLLAAEVEKRGVNAIHVTAGGLETRYWHTQPMALPRGCLLPIVSEIKKVVKVPVIAVGRINNPSLAEEVLQKGQADLIAVGRGLIADPEFPRKACEGRAAEINQCVACNYCRSRVAWKNYPVRCAVNPVAGREGELKNQKGASIKKVWVVGGGPAGLTAARILGEKGHEVSLFEARETGGKLNLVILPPCKEEYRNLLNSLHQSLEKSGVQISKKEVTGRDVQEGKPDVVIVATGARPREMNFGSSILQISADQLLEEGPGNQQTYVVIGGGQVGSETAEFLAERGKTVTVAEILPEIGAEYEPNTRAMLLQRLAKSNVKLLTRTKICNVSSGFVQTRNLDTGEEATVQTQVLVLAVGADPNRELYDSIQSLPCEMHLIGDARKPRGIAEAIFEGTKVAYNI